MNANTSQAQAHDARLTGPDAIDAATLASALEAERRLLVDLCGVLRSQRDSIARSDVDAVDDSVVGAHRILQNLDEARRRRRTLIALLGPAEDTPLAELEFALGPAMTPELAAARARLEEEAHRAAREIAINRRILCAVLAQGNRFLQGLCSVASAAYEPGDAGTRTTASGVLFDGRV